jgi:hypothetical protein
MALQLSVILVVGQRREGAERALASVLAQDFESEGPENASLRAAGEPALEVLVVDCAPGAPPPLRGSDRPGVRTIKLPSSTPLSGAKALAIRHAQAPVVAFLEEHAFASPGWGRALVAAHRGPWAAVGAEVHNANPARFLSRAVALMNYHPWLPPAPRREFSMLPGHNASFKREVLLAYGERLNDLLRAEIVLHTRLHQDGHRLLLEPQAKFFHTNEVRWSALFSGFFLFHRIYGPARASEFGWSRLRRALYIGAVPLIPLYFVARLLLIVAARRRRLLMPALIALPVFLLIQFVGALGQATGLLAGIGTAEIQFCLHELSGQTRGPISCSTTGS